MVNAILVTVLVLLVIIHFGLDLYYRFNEYGNIFIHIVRLQDGVYYLIGVISLLLFLSIFFT